LQEKNKKMGRVTPHTPPICIYSNTLYRILGVISIVDLRDVRKLRNRMEQIREHIEVLNSAVEYGERINKNGSGGGYASDKIPRIIARIAELTDEMVSCALDYDIEVTIAEEAIDGLSESEQKIARARYIDGLTWSKVAEQTGCSIGRCRNVNQKIIQSGIDR